VLRVGCVLVSRQIVTQNRDTLLLFWASLASTVIRLDLIDEYRAKISPAVLGG